MKSKPKPKPLAKVVMEHLEWHRIVYRVIIGKRFGLACFTCVKKANKYCRRFNAVAEKELAQECKRVRELLKQNKRK